VAITLSPDARKQALASLKQYLSEHLGEDPGDLQAGLLLDYILKDIGPSIYNRAIQDAQTYLQDRVADLEGVCHEKEFGYWQEQRHNARRK
jgi:uncharacterized protein (DUF2164 family)